MLYQLLIPQKTTFLGDSSDDFHLAFSPIHEQHILNHSWTPSIVFVNSEEFLALGFFLIAAPFNPALRAVKYAALVRSYWAVAPAGAFGFAKNPKQNRNLPSRGDRMSVKRHAWGVSALPISTLRKFITLTNPSLRHQVRWLRSGWLLNGRNTGGVDS